MKLVKVTVDGKEYYREVDTDEGTSAKETGIENRVRELLSAAGKIGKDAASALQAFVGAAKDRLDAMHKAEEKKTEDALELVKLLPYLPPEKMHEACLLLEAERDLWKKTGLEDVLPYMTPEDCDRLFLSYLNGGNRDFLPKAVLPFVSEKCLSEVLRGILAGEYDGLSAETLYPYLSKKDLCRLLSLYRKDGDRK